MIEEGETNIDLIDTLTRTTMIGLEWCAHKGGKRRIASNPPFKNMEP
jgi:hypothetical protein